MVLLDSTVLIDYLRGRPAADRVDALLEAGETLATTGINVEEIVRGLRGSEHESAQALFSGLFLVPIGAEEGWLAGTWRRDAAAQGATLAQSDCLIAAAAVTAGARLATGNPKDFESMPAPVEHWPVGQ
ncbi:MAG TPA: PIN domain-containing protein [Acidimicrobiales bacterium]|nr:PIN domain-containing protein [Acidimicrobiales bacterium]